LYSLLVYITALSGTHIKKEPLSLNGSAKGSFYGVCSFLYILDLTGFSKQLKETNMNKKRTFYSYASPLKYSIFREGMSILSIL